MTAVASEVTSSAFPLAFRVKSTSLWTRVGLMVPGLRGSVEVAVLAAVGDAALELEEGRGCVAECMAFQLTALLERASA